MPRNIEACWSHGALHPTGKCPSRGRKIRRVQADALQLEISATRLQRSDSTLVGMTSQLMCLGRFFGRTAFFAVVCWTQTSVAAAQISNPTPVDLGKVSPGSWLECAVSKQPGNHPACGRVMDVEDVSHLVSTGQPANLCFLSLQRAQLFQKQKHLFLRPGPVEFHSETGSVMQQSRDCGRSPMYQ